MEPKTPEDEFEMAIMVAAIMAAVGQREDRQAAIAVCKILDKRCPGWREQMKKSMEAEQ